jgi:hypothetical protein
LLTSILRSGNAGYVYAITSAASGPHAPTITTAETLNSDTVLVLMSTTPSLLVEIPDKLEYKGKRPVAVDHNHETGEVRGILCLKCNLVLGHARENTDILYKAIVYLSERGAYMPKGK